MSHTSDKTFLRGTDSIISHGILFVNTFLKKISKVAAIVYFPLAIYDFLVYNIIMMTLSIENGSCPEGSMKNRIRIIFAIILCLFAVSAFSACSPGKLLDTVESVDLTFYLYGGKSVEKIVVDVVSEGESGSEIQCGVSGLDGSEYEHYGFALCDLDFDGDEDIMLLIAKNENILSYKCYLQESTGEFAFSPALSGLKNIETDQEDKTVSGYDREKVIIEAPKDKPEVYEERYTRTYYKWDDGKLTKERYDQLIYYSAQDFWSYTEWVKDSEGEFTEGNERWLDHEQMKRYDFRP